MLTKHQQAGFDYANGQYDELKTQLNDYEATVEDTKKIMEKLRKAFSGEMGPSGRKPSLLENIRDTNKFTESLPQEAQAKLSTKKNAFQGAQKKMEDGLPYDLLELMYTLLKDHSGYPSVGAFVKDMEGSSDCSMPSAMDAESLHSGPSDCSMPSAMEAESLHSGPSDASMRTAMDMSVSSGRKPRRTPSRKPSRKSHAVPKQVSAKSVSADAVSVVTNNFDAMDIDTQLTGSSIKNGQAQAAIDNLTSGNQKPPASFVAPSSNLNPPSTPLGTSHQLTSAPVVSTPVATGRAATSARVNGLSRNDGFSAGVGGGSTGNGNDYEANFRTELLAVHNAAPDARYKDASTDVCLAHAYYTAMGKTDISQMKPVKYEAFVQINWTTLFHTTGQLVAGLFNFNQHHMKNFRKSTGTTGFDPIGAFSNNRVKAWYGHYQNEFMLRFFPEIYQLQPARTESLIWCKRGQTPTHTAV